MNWTRTSKYKQGTDYFRHNGAGEMLVFSAADFEDFRVTASGHAAGNGRRTGRSRTHPGSEQMAVAIARDLRRNHIPRTRRVREGQPGHAAR